MSDRYEVIVVGGGVAGLSAAIHLAWHQRRVLVIDRHSSPLFFTLETLYNVPGMPEIRGVDILRQLKAQAKELGADIVRGDVIEASGQEGDFELRGKKGEEWHAEAILLATGVARYHPTVDGDYRQCFHYAGKGNLYYCPDCEAPEIKDKSTVVIGVAAPDSASGMAIGLSRYTSDLRILQTGEGDLSEQASDALEKRSIGTITGQIAEFIGKKGHLEALRLDDDRVIEAEAWFVSSPTIGRNDLAKQLGVEMAHTGHHAQPNSQRGDTNVPGVWIAGDLRPMTQQVSVAMGTGNIAAVMIDQTLRKRDIAV